MNAVHGYTVVQTAQLVAALRWATGRLADMVGSWAGEAAVDAPEAAVWMTALSQRLRRHCEVLEGHQPDSVLLAPYRVACPPDPSVAAVVDEIAELDDDAARVVVAGSVLIPRLAGVYADVGAHAAPHCDAALASAAAILGHDLRRHIEAGDGLVGLVDAGVGAAGPVERRLASVGGILPRSLVRPDH